MSAALVPWQPRKVSILWLDLDNGRAVTDDGRALIVGDHRDQRPKLAEVLAAAQYAECPRVMLTGAKPPPAYLLGAAGGWTHGTHHLDALAPVGRYTNSEGGAFEIRRAAEWFGAGDYKPHQAAAAWRELSHALADAIPGMERPLASPAATGREAWLRSRSFDQGGQPVNPPQVSAEVAELLRATTGQHRIERFPEPASTTHRPPRALWLLDGRLMYVACVRELGIGPAEMLTDAGAAHLFDSNPYARARYQVRATVPSWWDTAGILPHKDTGNIRGAWEYPSKPGRSFTTWADAAEVHLATQNGWAVRFQAGMMFQPGRPLDTWAARLLRAYDRAGGDPEPGRAKLVRAGLRWMLLHSIGAWHSAGRKETTITPSPMARPQGEGWGPPTLERGRAVWRRTVPLDGRAAAMSHPEWAAQIWGRARARVLWAPTAVKGTYAGALTIPPAELVSIYGDAVMTTRRPPWAAARFDDGKPGRLRVKGHLPDLAAAGGWPTTSARRDRLMHAAEAFGAPLDQPEGD